MHYLRFPEYVPVSARRAKAEKKLKQLRKTKPNIKPVTITGRLLAANWWGKSWNSNLERYADYSNRIGRGRSYVRHGSVLDLRLTAGEINAIVQGSRSRPYDVVINVDKLSSSNWIAIRKACEGRFDSLNELLAGKFPKSLKDLFFKKDGGLFPSPKEIKFDCSCPDWASMCKHVAATLYGVGARLDEDPSLFFTLRGINVDDIITQTVAETTGDLLRKAERKSEKILDDIDVGGVFGIQMDGIQARIPEIPPPKTKKPKTAKGVVKNKTKTISDKEATKKRSTKKLKTTSTNRKQTTSNKKQIKKVKTDPRTNSKWDMVSILVKTVGKARRGKSIGQIKENLGWTKVQVRNAVSRAINKGLLEAVDPGVYRQKI